MTQSQMFCLGVILLAITGVSHKLRAQTAPAPAIKNMLAIPICSDPSGSCPMPDGIRRDVLGVPIGDTGVKVRSYLDEEELAKIRASVNGPAGGVCFLNGVWFPTRGGMCFTEDMQRIAPTTGVTVSAKPAPQCEAGWSLVDAGRPMCARELREPK